MTTPKLTSEELAVKFTELSEKSVEIKANFEQELEQKQVLLDEAIKSLDAEKKASAKAIELKDSEVKSEKTLSEKAVADLKAENEKALDLKVSEVKKLEDEVEKLKQIANRPNMGNSTQKGTEMDRKEFYESQKKLANEAIREAVKNTTNGTKIIDFGQKAMTTDSEQDGGLFLSDTRSDMIVELATTRYGFESVVNVVSLADGDTYTIPVCTDDGDDGNYVGERSDRPAGTTPEFDEVKISAHEQIATPKLSDKMLEDSGFDIVGYVDRKAAKSMWKKRTKAMLLGVGTKGPKGLLTYPAGSGLLEIPQLTTSTSLTPLFTDFSKLRGALPEEYKANAKWLMNKETKEKAQTFMGSDGHPLYKDSASAKDMDMFMGYPVVIDANMPSCTVAGALAVAFGDFEEAYTKVDRRGNKLIVDNLTEPGYTKFRNSQRNGGGLVKGEAVVIMKIKA